MRGPEAPEETSLAHFFCHFEKIKNINTKQDLLTNMVYWFIVSTCEGTHCVALPSVLSAHHTKIEEIKGKLKHCITLMAFMWSLYGQISSQSAMLQTPLNTTQKNAIWARFHEIVLEKSTRLNWGDGFVAELQDCLDKDGDTAGLRITVAAVVSGQKQIEKPCASMLTGHLLKIFSVPEIFKLETLGDTSVKSLFPRWGDMSDQTETVVCAACDAIFELKSLLKANIEDNIAEYTALWKGILMA